MEMAKDLVVEEGVNGFFCERSSPGHALICFSLVAGMRTNAAFISSIGPSIFLLELISEASILLLVRSLDELEIIFWQLRTYAVRLYLT